MKIRAILLSFLLLIPSSAAFAKGGLVFWSWGGENFYKVADLPDTFQFKVNNDFVDIGVIYKSVDIFFLPVWQSDMRYVAVIPNNTNTYYNFSEAEIMQMARSASISIPPVSQIQLDFWTAWGGKIVLLLLIAVFVMYSVMMPEKREEEEKPEPEQTIDTKFIVNDTKYNIFKKDLKMRMYSTTWQKITTWLCVGNN